MSARPSLATFRRDLALTAALVTFVFAILSAATLFAPLFAHLDSGEFSRAQMGGIAAYVLHLHETFWPVVAGALVASVASGMLLFERMRSPIKRFVRIYAELAQGRDPQPVKIRTTDYLQGEAGALNQLIEVWRERNYALRRELGSLDAALAELRVDGPPAKRESAHTRAEETVDAIRRILDPTR